MDQATPVPEVTSVINLSSAVPGEHFAPPPANSAPAITAQQAFDTWAKHPGLPIPSVVSVQLGAYTLPVGSDCGPACENGNTAHGGKVYRSLNALAYGYRQVLPDGTTEWLFLDANTGKLLGGVLPRLPAPSP